MTAVGFRVSTVNWTIRVIIWLLPYVIACGVLAGLFLMGALVLSHLYGMSMKNALIALINA